MYFSLYTKWITHYIRVSVICSYVFFMRGANKLVLNLPRHNSARIEMVVMLPVIISISMGIRGEKESIVFYLGNNAKH